MSGREIKLARVLDIDRENAEFQHLETLKRNRTKRTRTGEIFVEGVANINALLEADWTVVAIAHDRQRTLSQWGKDLMAQAKPAKILRLSTALMEKLSERQEPSELLVIARRKDFRLDALTLDARSVIVVFDRPSNHGNLGTLIRSCDAFGATALLTTGHAVDMYDPAVLRASLGAFFALPIIHCGSPAELEAWIGDAKQHVPGLRVIGTTAEAEQAVYTAALAGPIVVILGNEASGMSRKLAELVDENVRIPMQGRVDSLNVACAGTVMLYEIARQRALV